MGVEALASVIERLTDIDATRRNARGAEAVQSAGTTASTVDPTHTASSCIISDFLPGPTTRLSHHNAHRQPVASYHSADSAQLAQEPLKGDGEVYVDMYSLSLKLAIYS